MACKDKEIETERKENGMTGKSEGNTGGKSTEGRRKGWKCRWWDTVLDTIYYQLNVFVMV